MAQKDPRLTFLDWVIGPQEGWITINARVARSGEWQEHFFEYPKDLDTIVRYIESRQLIADLYFCPTLLRQPKCVKGNIDVSRVAWADLDTCDPENLLVPPTLIVQTSPGRYQGYWAFDGLQDAREVEDINRRIAYRHANEGCDKSGWDLTQRLRIIGTKNHKYYPDLHEIKVLNELSNLRADYTPESFGEYAAIDGSTVTTEPFPETLPTESAEELLEMVRLSLNTRAWELFEKTPDAGVSWSERIWQLEMFLLGAGLTPAQTFVVIKEAACNKYERDNKSDLLLWKEILRARDQQNNQTLALAASVEAGDEPDWYLPDQPLLTEEERKRVSKRKTVIEEYIEWAKTVGDAAPQYHEAGAFTILSALLAGRVRLPTSYGTIVPNLWFMILADTTLTRKTTAMDLAMDFLADIDPDCVLATDGSIEGLMTSISMRPGRPSIFLRDEFSGLLEMMSKRDYYAGMLETLTKLYDGKFQKRVLKKEIIEVREPVLLLFTGGIKERIYSLLSAEHINSGFIPRFCFITANSDLTRLRPLGPPTETTLEHRDELLDTFRAVYQHYNVVGIDDDDPTTVIFTKEWRVKMTPEAWIRYNKIEDTMLSIGINSSLSDALTPVLARLSQSGLKAAILIAAASRLDDEVVVHETDILHAFAYVERWKAHAFNVVVNAGKTAIEKELERIFNFIEKNPGAQRSKVMQVFRLHAREADAVFATLLQRNMIREEKQGRTSKLFPMFSRKINRADQPSKINVSA